MYPVSLFASIFLYSKQKSTHTCCLCEVHSVLKEKKVARASNFVVAVRAPSQQLFYPRIFLVASARLAWRLRAGWCSEKSSFDFRQRRGLYTFQSVEPGYDTQFSRSKYILQKEDVNWVSRLRTRYGNESLWSPQ